MAKYIETLQQKGYIELVSGFSRPQDARMEVFILRRSNVPYLWAKSNRFRTIYTLMVRKKDFDRAERALTQWFGNKR